MLMMLRLPIILNLFLLSILCFLCCYDSTRMFWVQNRYTSMLEIIPKDNKQGNNREDTKKY